MGLRSKIKAWLKPTSSDKQYNQTLDNLRKDKMFNRINPTTGKKALCCKQKNGFFKFADGTIIDKEGNAVA